MKDPMNMDQVLQMMLQISDQYMCLCEDSSWINYFVPDNMNRNAQYMSTNSFDDSSFLVLSGLESSTRQ
jgi:hypothetical protein